MRTHALKKLTLLAALALTASACSDDGGTTGPPVPVNALRFTTLSAGYFHTCGLTLAAKAYCWGGNAFGTLGDGTNTTREEPTIVASNRLFTALDAGAGHNCALTNEGSAFCWGHNDEGQVGDGTFTGRDAPVAVDGTLNFTAISAGHAHSCGLTSAGVAYCWGDDTRGQLGNGPPEGATKSAVPVRVLLAVPLTQVIAGYYQSCGLAANGDAYCWGANESGQNGDGTIIDRHEPVKVTGNRVFTALSPGDRFVCGVSLAAVYCWGANRVGELGRAADDGSLAPVIVSGLTTITDVFAASGTSTLGSADPYACALRTDGRVLCWGGAVRALRQRNPMVTALDDRLRVTDVALGAEHVCVLTRESYVFCGGANYDGQLGDGTRMDRARLVGVVAPATP